MNEALYWIWYNFIFSKFKRKAQLLYNKFGDIKKLYESNIYDYIDMDITDIKLLEELCNKDLTEAKKEMWYAENYNTDIVPIDSEEYPRLLKTIKNPPLILYKRGKNIHINDEKCVAVVGTRKVSESGGKEAYDAARRLAENGLTVVSGMAAGVDTFAHSGALDGGGKTVAVFACGVGTVYPASNKALMQRIIENGCVYSEYCFETVAFPTYFPQRNRIISGISESTLVMEADIKSGSIITARHANEQKRKLFTLKKYADNNSELEKVLTELGAEKIDDVNEIVKAYNIDFIPTTQSDEITENPEINPEYAVVLELLNSDDKTAEEISIVINKNIIETGVLLTMMEIEGLIMKTAEGKFMATKSK